LLSDLLLSHLAMRQAARSNCASARSQSRLATPACLSQLNNSQGTNSRAISSAYSSGFCVLEAAYALT
jgi:hypothetical protein